MPLLPAVVAAGRLLFGISLLVRPKLVGRLWAGDVIEAPGPRMMVRAIGARDAILGCEALCAMAAGRPARAWLQAGIAADVLDTAIALGYARRMPRAGAALTLMATSGGAAIGWLAAREADAGAGDGDAFVRSITIADA